MVTQRNTSPQRSSSTNSKSVAQRRNMNNTKEPGNVTNMVAKSVYPHEGAVALF
jgi:hypothetical protein